MKHVIHCKQAPDPVGPYNQAIEINGLLFISGQIAIDQSSGNLILDSIESETNQVMKNIQLILEEAGYTWDDVIKCSVFVKDMHQYGVINSIYSHYFTEDRAPARELVEVANLPKFVNVEISAIAARS